jgi:hypothetical protein
MTGTPDFGYHVDNHSSLDTRRMSLPTPTEGDFVSRAVGSVVGPFIVENTSN